MHPLPHYALLGSLIAGAAGVLVLAVVTITHGLRRRETADTARRQRLLRLADTAVVLCFAVAAGLGVVGLMKQSRAVPQALAASDDGALSERLQALEKRLARAELELQARTGVSATEWRAWEERIARLESQFGALEQRTTAAARREEPPRSAPAARKNAPPAPPAPAPSVPPPPSASPRLAPEVVAPTAGAGSTSSTVGAPITAPSTPPAHRGTLHTRVAPPARVEPSAAEPSLGAKLRRDWDERDQTAGAP